MEEKDITSFQVLFFNGARRVTNSIEWQIHKLFPTLDVTVVQLGDQEPHCLKNVIVVGYSLGARRALDWVSQHHYEGPVFLLDPECWNPSRWYVWATETIVGKSIFKLVVPSPQLLGLFSWALPKRNRKYLQLFIANKKFREQLYQDWQAAAEYTIVSMEKAATMKSLMIVTSDEQSFLKYIPVEKIQQLGMKHKSMPESSHSQLWKHFFTSLVNPNEKFQ